MMTVALCLNQAALATACMLCVCGLLRAREALRLTRGQIVFGTRCAVLLLGNTKRGVEEKVVLRHPGLLQWLRQYLACYPDAEDGRVSDVPYSRLLSWLPRLAAVLGAPNLQLTTHSLRRSGATELSRMGTARADLMEFGRWHNERAAREYIRRGEVALLQANRSISPKDWARIAAWHQFSG